MLDNDSLYSARLEIFKFEGDGESSSSGNKALNGVEFKLKNEDGLYYKLGADKLIHWVGDEDDATTLVTGQLVEDSGTPMPVPGNYYDVPSIPEKTSPAALEEIIADGWTGDSPYYGEYYVLKPGDTEGSGVGDIISYRYSTDDGNTVNAKYEEILAYTITYENGDVKRIFDVAGRMLYLPGENGWNSGDETFIPAERDGFITINGLGNGNYTLIETKPLRGYNPANDVTISIANENNTFEELKYQVNIANRTGSVLPSTGGPGVTIIYVIGTMMFISSSALLYKKKRENIA